ncbi:MAG: hypothetical protein ACLUDK_00195 [Clostridium paraputrificum]
MINNKDNIENFFKIVYELKESIDTIKNNGEYLRNHHLTLNISLLDFLSKSYNPEERSNRIRFCSLIKDMTSLDYLDKVSIPQLYYYLQKDSSIELNQIRRFVEIKYKEIPRSIPVDINMDIEIDTIKEMWPRGYKYNGEKVFLEMFQHINILWKERNNLIHEMRRRTLGGSFFEERERPYYVHFMGACGENGFDSDEYFELCYPERIYEIILDECIINLKEYFVQRNRDPFGSFNSDQLIAVQL